MTTVEGRRRTISWAGYRSPLLLCAIYAALQSLLLGGFLDAFRMKEHAVCGQVLNAFKTEGRAGVSDQHLVQEETDRVIVMVRHTFPYAVSSFPTHSLDEYSIHAIGTREGDPGFRVIPRVTDQPLAVGATLVWGDKLLLWGSYRARRGDDRSRAHVVLDRNGGIRVLPGRGLLRPLAIDDRTGSLISIEERRVLLGGQPKEAERPPQRLVFERLDASGLPLEEGASEHPIRRLLTVVADDRGHVYIARWQGETVPPYYSHEAYLFVEKYSIPQQQILWSVQVNAEPAAVDRLERLELALTPDGVRVEHGRWVLADPADPQSHKRLRVQGYTFDPVRGTRMREELFDDPTPSGYQTPELVLRGRRYAFSNRLGSHRNCVALTPLD